MLGVALSTTTAQPYTPHALFSPLLDRGPQWRELPQCQVADEGEVESPRVTRLLTRVRVTFVPEHVGAWGSQRRAVSALGGDQEESTAGVQSLPNIQISGLTAAFSTAGGLGAPEFTEPPEEGHPQQVAFVRGDAGGFQGFKFEAQKSEGQTAQNCYWHSVLNLLDGQGLGIPTCCIHI